LDTPGKYVGRYPKTVSLPFSVMVQVSFVEAITVYVPGGSLRIRYSPTSSDVTVLEPIGTSRRRPSKNIERMAKMLTPSIGSPVSSVTRPVMTLIRGRVKSIFSTVCASES
jgi:hypothetical protein